MTHSPPFAAVRRTLSAPWLVLTFAAIHLALAAAVATPVRAAFRAAMGPYFHEAPTRLLAPLLELIGQQRAAAATLVSALIVAAAVAVLTGPLLASAAIQRLHGPCKPGDMARAAISHYPASLVIAVYGLLLRALLLLVAAAIGGVHPIAQLLLSIAALTYATTVVDLTRARVVLTGARGFHPRTFLRAARAVTQDARLWLGGAALSLFHTALMLTIVLVALHGLGTTWSPWAARGLALVAMFVSLARIAVAVQHVSTHPDE